MQIKKLLDSYSTDNAYAICRFENCNLKDKHILINEPGMSRECSLEQSSNADREWPTKVVF